jgi:thiamine-phosphate pyrophosphorylase
MTALPRLMYVTNRKLMGEDGPELVEALRRAVWALPPFSILVHIREADLPGRALVELCRAYLPVIRDASQQVVVGDRLDVARFVGADGVHLPSQGLEIIEARRQWPGAIVGRSCHAVSELEAAADADYAVLSPIFPTPSKKDRPGLGLAALEEAGHSGVPVYALGGLDAKNAAQAFGAGAYGVAVMRAAWQA